MKNRDESRILLVENDQLQKVEQAKVYYSGYDSTCCSSDNETFNDLDPACNISRTNVNLERIWRSQHQYAIERRVNFQDTANLSSHLRYIMGMPELCDIVFLVGIRNIPVYGVKAVLATRSRVMHNLILKNLREADSRNGKQHHRAKERSTRTNCHLIINVRKYQHEDFAKIIEYLHCGTVDISMSNVAGMLCGACQFGLEDLKTACWNFIEYCTRNKSIALLIPSARKYNQHTIGRELLFWIASLESMQTSSV